MRWNSLSQRVACLSRNGTPSPHLARVWVPRFSHWVT